MLLKKIVTGLKSSPVSLMNQARFSFVHKVEQNVENERQELFLDTESCILVNELDKIVGKSSKRDCHKLDDQENIKLHRAFSVFLFNQKGEMLLQRRSSHKASRTQVVNR